MFEKRRALNLLALSDSKKERKKKRFQLTQLVSHII